MKYFYFMPSPLGKLYIGEEEGKVIYVGCREKIHGKILKTPTISTAIDQLEEYFAGKRKEFTLPIHVEGGDFQKRVLHHIMDIPYGKAVDYTEVAQAINCPNGARVVGNALGNNPILILIPCHRVIRRDKKLGGYRGGSQKKSFLLKLEGYL
ncbi:methylated-DNA--[protein]-cysteine S-methyltransferase [Lagierella sp.]|uniref:methylated-DNA--[protein]-cysteine S-methyltransferase n=1 Tax=Lagierella sp. TaxID=2849657 RepID=UPI002637AF51|nr:methylated-DNA--[protein]-cysteine S-methyltransferase [Lagierella sp.]